MNSFFQPHFIKWLITSNIADTISFPLQDRFQEWLSNVGFSDNLAVITKTTIVVIAIIILCILANFITKKIIISILTRIIKKSKNQWDDIFLEKKVFNRLSQLAPAIIIYFTVGFALVDYPAWVPVIKSATYIYILLIGLMVIDSLLNALHEIYGTFPISKERPIKGFVQVVKIIIYFVVVILILSILLNKNPAYFLTGLGAVAAVLMLVFKDTILGFVASVQLSANNMVKIGDWISMPSQGADGTVTEISLNTIKVQNWDKTISTIPTYTLVSDSFKNWKGMEESGGRRIKRSINIDMKSVKFCSDEMLNKFKKIHILLDYIKFKRDELNKYNKENDIDETVKVNGRRLTNIGIFRKYLEEYLKSHPKIHNNMTFMVRQLQPMEKGIPIEIYGFSNDQSWVNYEGIQSDIFDHILAVVPEYDLKIFQNPTGDDFRTLRT